MLIQKADVGLRAQRDVVLISSGFAAAVLLLLFRSSLAPSLKQLLELRFHERLSEPSPMQSGALDPGAGVRILALGRGSCAPRCRAAPSLRSRRLTSSPLCLGTMLLYTDTSLCKPGAIPHATAKPSFLPSFVPATQGPDQQLPALSQWYVGYIILIVLILRLGAASCGSCLVGASPLQIYTSQGPDSPTSLPLATHADPSEQTSHLPLWFGFLHSLLYACAPRQTPAPRLSYDAIQSDVKKQTSAASSDLSAGSRRGTNFLLSPCLAEPHPSSLWAATQLLPGLRAKALGKAPLDAAKFGACAEGSSRSCLKRGIC